MLCACVDLQSVLLAGEVFVEAAAELGGVEKQFVVGHGEENFVDVHQVVGGPASDRRRGAALRRRHLLHCIGR